MAKRTCWPSAPVVTPSTSTASWGEWAETGAATRKIEARNEAKTEAKIRETLRRLGDGLRFKAAVLGGEWGSVLGGVHRAG